jgi:hypothetical protein
MKQILFRLFENLKQLGIKPNIGSRTNVTPIPGSEIDRLINRPVTPKEFDYSKPEVVDSMRGIIQNASDYVGQFTERQLKTFNNNVERILGIIKPKETTADVVDLATKEKITGPGLESLMKEKGVASISRKTIEAETLIKQFLDDDLISLNAKQIDQLSRGKAEDVFENIFGSKAKELITGKNTNESLNEVYNKLKTTKDTRGRLPDDPSFDPSDIEFKDGGSVSEDVRKLLKEEFIELINANPESFPDTNAGFRRFLKRKGSPVFNYKEGGRVNLRQGGGLYPEELLPLIGKDTELSNRELEKLFSESDMSEEDISKYYKKYPIKLGDLEINPRVNITSGDFSPNPFTTVSDKSQLSGGDIRYKIKDGIYATGSLDKQRNSRNIKYDFPFMDEAITQSNTYKRSPYTVGLDYEGDQSVITSAYDPEQKQFNIRGTYLFEPGGGLNKLFKGYGGMKKGGVANLFKKRKRYAEGGFITMKDNGDYVVTYPSGSSSLYSGTSNPEFLQHLISQGYSFSGQQGSTGMSTPTTTEIPTVDPFSGQQVSAQDQAAIENIKKRLDYLKSLDPNYLVPGSAGGMVLEDVIAGQQETLNDILNKYTNQPTNFPTIDPFTGKPYGIDPNAPVQPIGPSPPDNYYDEVPTVDPFSGQQVSAQDQAAFATTSGINFNRRYDSLEYDPATNNYIKVIREGSNAGGNEARDPIVSNVGTGIFSGPAYDTYSQARTDAYTNSPNKFTYDVTANQAAGQFAQDKLKELLGDNILSQTLGTIGTVAAVPFAFYSSPFHEVAQVINEGRMEPGSGIKGFYDAFMNELPLSTAANRAAGVLKSIPGIGESIYSGAYNLGESLGNLRSNISNPTVQRTVNVGSYDPGVQALGASIGNLDYSTMNALRNNASMLNSITGQTANMANGGLTKTVPPVRGPSPQGVESLFRRRYN